MSHDEEIEALKLRVAKLEEALSKLTRATQRLSDADYAAALSRGPPR